MSQENVEVVRRHIDAYNRRDLMTLLALWHPDAEIDWSQSRGPLRGVYSGYREYEAFWKEFWSMFEEIKIEPHDFTEIGSEVVVTTTAHLRGREEIEVVARNALVYRVESGQITRLRMFQEEAEALEAVGLSEQDAHADS
jgi:ketosteroid isomerase-like protein